MSPDRYTISVDFDGVLHRYDSPWVAPEIIPDPPVEGAIEWLNEMSRHFDIVIHTTRAQTEAGRLAVMSWLFNHKANFLLNITNVKQPSLVYIDDRGWRFEGRFPTRQEIHEARPWNKPAT